MSLHVLANHMATKGRGPDSMLVHMSPQEVASLQALAMKNGGSLTINPDTGLPEAGFLKKLLPAIAGAALNFFAPGVGTAIGGALGIGAAAGTGVAVGGITALATGSLSKGLQAGLGAYGGASLASSLMNSGTMSLAEQAAQAAGSGAERAALSQGLSAETVAAMKAQALEEAGNQAVFSNADKLSAGFSAAKDAPMGFLKDNWKAGLAAASPFIADAMVPTTTKMPAPAPVHHGYIRSYDYNPYTQSFTRLEPVKAGYNNGGIVALADGGEADPYTKYNTLTGQSKSAYDYLMGNARSSGVGVPVTQPTPIFTSTQTPAKPTTPAPSGGITDLPTAPVDVPVGPTMPYMPPEIPVETPIDDRMSDEEAISRIEDAVADEQYNQENQDAIDRVEENIYNEESQNAATRFEEAMREEALAESARASDIDDATISTDPVYVSDDGTTEGIEQLIREMTPVQETPAELLNQDEFGDLQAAIERNMEPVQDDGTTEAIQREALAQENPWGNLDDFIASQRLDDSARASAIDDATISVDDYSTYSGFTPEPANPNIPVEDRTPSSSSEDFLSALAAGVDPVTGVARDNGAAEAAIREQEAAEREEAARLHEAMNYDRFIPEPAPYIPEPEPYVPEPYVPEPAPYIPEPEPYVPEPAPYVPEPAPYVPEPEPYVPEPYYENPYVPEPAPYVPEPAPYIPDYYYESPYVPDPYVPSPDEDFPSTSDYVSGGGGGIPNGFMDAYSNDAFGGFDNSFDSYGFMSGFANGGALNTQRYAMGGGLGSLGGYSDGGRLLKGPGDGVSDSIPATIGRKKQPARLADGEFVVPARIVSELGNGSTEAGARKLYAMMDRIQKARGKTVGKGKVAANSRAEKHLPA